MQCQCVYVLSFNIQVAYYNIMMCAGRVEVKLRQSEIEDYDKKLQEKQTEIGSLKESLEQKQQKLLELEDRIRRWLP